MSLVADRLCERCLAVAAPGARYCPNCGSSLPDGLLAPPQAGSALLARVRQALVHEYDIAHEIGRGGMAVVYLARDLRLPRKVALKVMLPELVYADTMPQRFLGEARTAAMLDHPGIVPIFNAGERDGILHFAMRFIGGCSLEQLLRVHSPLPVGLACRLLMDVAAALEYAHGEGVVHRDVKPSNVMLDRRWGRAVVTDFGIARVVDAKRITTTGLAVGTPEYMSPEQCVAEQPTGASDQYSLGIVAYEMLTGHAPFSGSQLVALAAQLRDTPRPLRHARPELPAGLEAVVLRMIAKDPADRWPSLSQVAAELSAFVTEPESALRAELVRTMPDAAADAGGASPGTPVSPLPVAAASTGAHTAGTLAAHDAPPAATGAQTAEAAARSATTAGDGLRIAPAQGPAWVLDAPTAGGTDAAMPAPTAARGRRIALAVGAACLVGTVAVLALRAGTTTTADVRTGGMLAAGRPAATADSAPLAGEPQPAVSMGLLTDDSVMIDGMPRRGRLTLGDTVQLSARLSGPARPGASTRPTVWRTSDPAVVTVDRGTLVARGVGGPVTLTVMVEGRTAERRLTVQPRPVESIPPTDDEGRAAVGALVRAIDLHDMPEVERMLGASNQGAEFRDQFLAWLQKRSDVNAALDGYTVGAFANGQQTVTFRLNMNWRGTLRRVRRVASFQAVLAREGSTWHVASAALTEEFKP